MNEKKNRNADTKREVKVVGNGIFSISYDSYWPVYECSTHFDALSTFTSKVYLLTSILWRNRITIIGKVIIQV